MGREECYASKRLFPSHLSLNSIDVDRWKQLDIFLAIQHLNETVLHLFDFASDYWCMSDCSIIISSSTRGYTFWCWPEAVGGFHHKIHHYNDWCCMNLTSIVITRAINFSHTSNRYCCRQDASDGFFLNRQWSYCSHLCLLLLPRKFLEFLGLHSDGERIWRML